MEGAIDSEPAPLQFRNLCLAFIQISIRQKTRDNENWVFRF